MRDYTNSDYVFGLQFFKLFIIITCERERERENQIVSLSSA